MSSTDFELDDDNYGDDDVGFDLAIIGDDELGDDGDGEQIFEELSNSTVTLVDVPDW